MLDPLPYCHILLIKICPYHFNLCLALFTFGNVRQVGFSFKAITYPVVTAACVELDSRLNLIIMHHLVMTVGGKDNNCGSICAYDLPNLLQ